KSNEPKKKSRLARNLLKFFVKMLKMGELAALRQYHFLNAFFLEFLNANFVMPAESQNLNRTISSHTIHTHNRRDRTYRTH
ncbi:MAG: hypothetical protein J7K51_09480, partial [Thermotogae bacterium]|nr:hypothetical protein [Thermotogota bacterium]